MNPNFAPSPSAIPVQFGPSSIPSDQPFPFHVSFLSMASEENPSNDGWVNPHRPLTRPLILKSRPSVVRCETRRRPDATPAAISSLSGGLLGGVSVTDVGSVSNHHHAPPLYDVKTDPYWIWRSKGRTWGDEPLSDEEENDESDDESILHMPPVYFPWRKSGETWEEAKADARQRMKDEGLSMFDTLDDEKVECSDEIGKKK